MLHPSLSWKQVRCITSWRISYQSHQRAAGLPCILQGSCWHSQCKSSVKCVTCLAGHRSANEAELLAKSKDEALQSQARARAAALLDASASSAVVRAGPPAEDRQWGSMRALGNVGPNIVSEDYLYCKLQRDLSCICCLNVATKNTARHCQAICFTVTSECCTNQPCCRVVLKQQQQPRSTPDTQV